MKKCSKQTLVAVSSLSLFLLSACVSQTKYDDLNAQYQQLQAAFNDDQAEIVWGHPVREQAAQLFRQLQVEPVAHQLDPRFARLA